MSYAIIRNEKYTKETKRYFQTAYNFIANYNNLGIENILLYLLELLLFKLELLPLTLHTLLLLLAEGEASHHLSANPKIKFLKFNSLLLYNFFIIKINCFKKNLVGFAT